MQSLSERTFRDISDLMYEAIGLSFADNKKSLVSSRLASRIQKLGLENYEDYLEIISGTDDAGEFQMAVDLLTTNETYFFREPQHFDFMEGELKGWGSKPLSVWSAACSFGDEVYSIAMLLSDMQMSGRIGSEWNVLGTDISDRVLRSASQGIFPEDRLKAVSTQRLKRYCLRGEEESEGLVQIQGKVRQHVRFGMLNLCRPIEPLGPFDVIFLRNVLIYFDAATKAAVVDRVLSRLKPGGLFFIGTAEGRVACQTPLKTLIPGAFRKQAA